MAEQLKWVINIESTVLEYLAKMGASIDNATKKLGLNENSLNKNTNQIKEIGKAGNISFEQVADKVNKVDSNLDSTFLNMMKFNQALEGIKKISEAFSFGGEIAKLKRDVTLFLEGTGEDIDKQVIKISELSNAYKINGSEIAKAANATAKQMNISFSDALEVINSGFKKGANINGDYLQQLQKFSSQLKSTGLSAKEMTALIAYSGKQGIFSDKAVDSIKEAGIKLREMGTAQVESLNAIGVSVDQLSGKSEFEAVKIISQAMSAASSQAKQNVISNIFRGAGEGAGLKFIEGIGSIDLNLDNMIEVESSTEKVSGFFGSLKGYIGSAGGELIEFSSKTLEIAGGIGAGIPVLQNLVSWVGKLNVMQKLAAIGNVIWTAAQWALNTAMLANPFALIAVGIIAAITAIIIYWDEIVGAITKGWEMIKGFFGFAEEKKDVEVNVNVNKTTNKTENILTNSQNKNTDLTKKENEKTSIIKPLSEQKNDVPKLSYEDNSLKLSSSGKSDNTSSVGGKINQVSVKIENLIKGDIIFKTENIKQSASELKQMVFEALTSGVRNFELAS